MRSTSVLGVVLSLLLTACGAGEGQTTARAPTRAPVPEAVQADAPPTDQQSLPLSKGKIEARQAQFSAAAAPAPRPAIAAQRPTRPPPPR